MINQTRKLQSKIHQYHSNPRHQPPNQNHQKNKHDKRYKNHKTLITKNEIYTQQETSKLPNPELQEDTPLPPRNETNIEQETSKLLNSEPETVTPTLPEPTLIPIDRQILSHTQQESCLCWRGWIDVGGG